MGNMNISQITNPVEQEAQDQIQHFTGTVFSTIYEVPEFEASLYKLTREIMSKWGEFEFHDACREFGTGFCELIEKAATFSAVATLNAEAKDYKRGMYEGE